MRLKRTNTASGVITFHTPFSLSLLKSEECVADVKDASESRRSSSQPRSPSKCVRAEKRDEASPPGPQQGNDQDRLSHSSLRRLQAKMETENQQAKEIIQPLLDTENCFVKKLETFLNQWDVTELRRRELQHKRWTERVWFPLQRRVEERASSCSPVALKRRQSLYTHYLQHCNSKGFVFLETYDLREYNPFLLRIKKPHYLKLKENRTARSCEAGFKYTRAQDETLPQRDRPFSESDILPQALFNHRATASRKIPTDDQSARWKSSRLNTISHHISATAQPDGRCHQTGCWISRCGCRQQPASL
ncbi:protein FAM228A [Epinephelus fuscoguttatus]|uniref:protein FAM228A n=1 Tax=Epinephelus fuscoguttatus TaxID=293821 RepID=UPI0020D0DF34|nr:protein FAM228A [Epinephelus fuscoguttatus]